MASITVQYTIPFGSAIRIGYKVVAASGPYTYLNYYPSYNQSPYTFSGIPVGTYEVELTTVCQNCSGPKFSNPIIQQALAV